MRWGRRAVSLLAAGLLAGIARADEVGYPAPPEPPDYVADEAEMLEPEQEEAISARCAALMDERYVPIVVVTIPSLRRYGAQDLSVERYARRMFNEYEIGRANWNYGVLLLIAKGDRKARIELGAALGRDYDPTCQEIMDDLIIRQFKRGRFAEGISLGVDGLLAMVRGLELPESPGGGGFVHWFHGLSASTCMIFAVAGILGLRYLHRIVWLLVWAVTLGRVNVWLPAISLGGGRVWSRGYGGGFSGGGFSGGGFSGGGGATGGW